MEILIRGAVWLLNAYSWMVFACVILSWFPELQRNKIAEILSRIVDPFLAIFRKFIPSIGGWDVSPLVAILLLHFAALGLSRW